MAPSGMVDACPNRIVDASNGGAGGAAPDELAGTGGTAPDELAGAGGR
jgi:hypothetical protein